MSTHHAEPDDPPDDGHQLSPDPQPATPPDRPHEPGARPMPLSRLLYP